MAITNSNKEEEEILLTDIMINEILKREKDLADETTFLKDWEAVKEGLFDIYC